MAIQQWVNGQKTIGQDMITWAEETAKDLVDIQHNGRSSRNALTSSTIRRFFGEMRRIQSAFKLEDAQMLQAKLAYDAGRKGGKVKTFYNKLKPGIQAIESKESFDRFVKIAEAIVSFHKFHYAGNDD